MLIYPWQEGVRLSPIQSNAVILERLAQGPSQSSQDCYFIVMLTSGKYKLEQAGREIFLKLGDMTVYDATEPHRITIPEVLSKILISIPRTMLDQRLNNIGKVTATRVTLPLKALMHSLVVLFDQQFNNSNNFLNCSFSLYRTQWSIC